MKNTNYYVTMTDSFMSGWGRASGQINKLVFECDTFEEAETVEAHANNRTDQKYVNICANFPRHLFNNSKYYTQLKDKNVYPAWYK
jgi:hypothetical protein